jgi:hypothetical protein
MLPCGVEISAQDAHFQLHEIARFHFDVGKHVPWSPRVLYVGVETDWSRDWLGVVTVGVTEKRREKIRLLIESHIEAGRLTSTSASSLRGKSRFCLCPVFGRAGLAVVTLLRGRQHDESGRTDIDDELADVLAALALIVQLLPGFSTPIGRDIRPPLVILTDASFEVGSTWIGFLLCCPWNGARWAGCPTPPWLLRLLETHRKRDTYIGQIEAAVVAAPIWSCPDSWFRGRACMHYIDNQGALYSMINGRSNDQDMNRLVFVTRLQLDRLACRVWFDYVPSASNFADLPTRLDAAAFARLERIASRVPLRLPPEWCLSCKWAELKSLFA